MDRWRMSDEEKLKFSLKINKFIQEVEREKTYISVLELEDIGLNPYKVWMILEELGYEKQDIEKDVWRIDFQIPFTKKGRKKLIIEATGITFELQLKAEY